ncbi:MAG: CRISPR-associated protein Csx16 [Gammaproteobacteria bacterium]|nr:CRISPR-associated protein Csx16 [Gammaproteobacteria bacterium]
MTTWFISRHPGALHWMQSNDIHFDHHLTHLDNEPIQPGDTVIGSLPVNLAAEVCAKGANYWNLSLMLPETARGRELSADELDLYQAKLEAFTISLDQAAPNPALQLPEPKKHPESPAPTASPTPVITEPVGSSVEPAEPRQITAAKKPPAPTYNEVQTWQHELFKAFIFNQNNQSKAEQDAARLLDNYSQRTLGYPDQLQKLETAMRQGRHATNLAAALLKKINSGTPHEELQTWVDKQVESQPRRIGRHLQLTLDKTLAFRENKKQQFKQNRGFNITLPYTQLQNGLHPQSLRAQKPCGQWDIYIDETGSNFSADAKTLNESDTTLGRIIALALPQSSKLQPLDSKTHAVDLSHSKIQDLLRDITHSKCGILGATLKQDLLSYNWMSAVHQLMRWSLLMLPMGDDKPCRVRIHIEARPPYDSNEQLQALQDTLDSELKRLLPERFQNLHLSLHIMNKDHPYNGYVDVIANVWGSKDSVKRQLLARTGWRGNCLLQTSDLTRVEDIYRSINSGQEVNGYNWFELCAASLDEPEHSLLHDLLQQLGEHSRINPQLWLACLDEVRQRLNRKDFTPASLRVALGWLESYQNSNQQLPAHLLLEHYSLQLAASNHEGATGLDQIAKLLPLIKELSDECPEAACQAVLRTSVRSSHLYDFKSTLPLLDEWLAYPVAVPGLLNHAKLHSTKGQLLAFQGQHQAALDSFAQALKSLERLSDPQQRSRESTQTSIYQAIVMQDMQHEQAASQTLQLVNQATTSSGQQATARLARSGSVNRFPHYLLLRLLVNQPDLSEQRQAYLAEQSCWQSGNGHPWMLIEAYRGWLLQQQGENDAASELLQMAVDDCMDAGQPMLVWMGHCLHALACSLNLPVELPTGSTTVAAHYPAVLLTELAQATDHSQRLQLLQQLLPFNFH